jgi:ankyrin repeat protein
VPLLVADSKQFSTLLATAHFKEHCADITAALLDRYKQQQQQLSAVINQRDSAGNTALRNTVRYRDDRRIVCHGCMRLLLAAGADIIAHEWDADILAEVIRDTTICDDTSQHLELTVHALVQRGVDLEHRDANGNTQLLQRAQHVAKQTSVVARAVAVSPAAAAAAAANPSSARYWCQCQCH